MQTATLPSGAPTDAHSEAKILFALRAHWPEYLIEATALGIFMVSACMFAALLEHPISPIHQAIESADIRRAVAGAAMGLTAIGIFCSPWGQRSGAHMNPAVTLSFLTLGKIRLWDAIFYVLAQFAGGILGVGLSSALIGDPIRHSAVNYVVTVPGSGGEMAAFLAEVLISGIMMIAVLTASNSKRFHWVTPFLAGSLVTAFITFEGPWSGMSMNPARTLGSAVWAGEWAGIWIYFTAPPLGMLLAAQAYRICRGLHRVYCAKILHGPGESCIFRCNYRQLKATGRSGIFGAEIGRAKGF